MLRMFLSFSVISYLSTGQISTFRTSTSHSANESQAFRFGGKVFLDGPSLLGVGKIFSPRPEPAVGACV